MLYILQDNHTYNYIYIYIHIEVSKWLLESQYLAKIGSCMVQTNILPVFEVLDPFAYTTVLAACLKGTFLVA